MRSFHFFSFLRANCLNKLVELYPFDNSASFRLVNFFLEVHLGIFL